MTDERLTAPLQPMHVRTDRIVLGGVGVWSLALIVTLLVPALHTGERSWWPWTCASGIVLGLTGLVLLRRGRGNFSDS